MNKLLITLIFIGISFQDCLPEAALKYLGFTNVKTTPEKITDSKFCKGRFAEHGICVSIDEFQ